MTVSAEKTQFWNWVPVMTYRYRQMARTVWLLLCVFGTAVCVADDYQAIRARVMQHFVQSGDAVNETIQQANKAGLAADTVAQILSRASQADVPASDFKRILGTLIEAEEEGLPVEPFSEKVMEGLAKNAGPDLIVEVLDRKLITYRESIKILADNTPQDKPDTYSVTSVALAIERGISPQGLRSLFSTGGYDPASVSHAAHALADLVSLGFTESEGVEITRSGLNAGYLGKGSSTITQVAARAKKDGLSNRAIAETMAAGFNRGMPLAEILVELRSGGARGGYGGGMRGGRGNGGSQDGGSHGNGPGGGRHTD
jgi:hypothetical protein